ncbi:5-formyltetrahydrofolate cyclo-ligase [Tenacibaculum amylolyticum]|uniref:5-formyltetrahydrofolate cyclo-ligase n=1 Tax=Tenacibaculum amylolyticum TaxID=104269 RepID=UPI00389499A6
MDKKELRKIYKQKRKELTESEIEQLQNKIYNQVSDLDFTGVSNAHIFLPIEKQKEINTYPIIEFLRKRQISIIISKSNFKDNSLKHYIFAPSTTLEINEYGIPEPVGAEDFDVTKIDLVFVPLLISDKKNYRVGYGKGFYDRFLSNCKADVITVGLNFFSPVDTIEGLDKYDIPLQKVIYP